MQSAFERQRLRLGLELVLKFTVRVGASARIVVSDGGLAGAGARTRVCGRN